MIRKMSVFIFLLSICVAAPAWSETRLVIADFDGESLVNNLQGESCTWAVGREDASGLIRATTGKVNGPSGETGALKIDYDLNVPDDAVCGFSTQLRRFDASPFDHFEFFVKGDAKAGYPKDIKIEFSKTRITSDGEEETIKGSYVVKGITSEWQRVSIPLNVMNGIDDWNNIGEFVIALQKRRIGGGRGALYFDDMSFVNTGVKGPSVRDVVPHKKKKLDKEVSSEEFARYLASRLNGFPEKLRVKKTFPGTDREFLKEIARDTWKYFDNFVDKEYQLPLDYVRLGDEAPLSKGAIIGDYTNVTDIGLYMICVVSAYDLGFIKKDDAIRRLSLTLDSIEKLEKHRGFPYNYYDITIFQRTSNFISFVDSGWLAAGLIVAKNAFPPALEKRCDRILSDMDFSIFYDEVEGQMYHGYYTNIEYFSEYHYGAFYTEPRAVSYIAIGKGDVPKEHWFMLSRTFPEDWTWQTQTPKGRKEKKCLGYRMFGGYYEYDDIKYVPSWGGSMFEALMPAMVINEKRFAKKGLGPNGAAHVKVQMKYAERLGYPVFGMSPCSVPGDGYSEFGVKQLGLKGYKEGIVTPHATFLALEFAPKECIANLRAMLRSYDIYGEYGFYDSIDVRTGKVDARYLCLDQAMTLIALNNYLNNDAVRSRFHMDRISKNAEELLKAEDFFE